MLRKTQQDKSNHRNEKILEWQLKYASVLQILASQLD